MDSTDVTKIELACRKVGRNPPQLNITAKEPVLVAA